jgi:hypothetical protein
VSKPCKKCHINKPLLDFYVNKNVCKECHSNYFKNKWASDSEFRERGRERGRSKPLYYKNYDYKRRYGITLEEFNIMLSNQNGKCAICNKSQKSLCVDHSHSTNKVRGLLCRKCNLGIGHLDSSILILKQSILYLEKSI